MKKSLLALALFAFAGTTAFAHDGHDKDGKKGKKESCSASKGSMAGGSCCMKRHQNRCRETRRKISRHG